MKDFLISLDSHLFFLINNGLAHAWLDPLFKALSWLGQWAIGLVALAALAGEERKVLWRRHVPVLLLGALLAGGVNRVIKESVHAPRPGKAFAGQLANGSVTVRFLERKIPMRKSFPSGHSVTAFFLMTYVTLRRPRHGWWALPLAALIALSRVYVGAHFPSDCLAGALLGALGGWWAWKFSSWLARREGAPA